MEEPTDTLDNALMGVGWDQDLTFLHLDGEEHAEKVAEIKEGYKIDDPEKADWAIKRLKGADREYNKHLERIMNQRKIVSDFEAKIRTKHKRESDFFIELLRDWATDEIKKTKGKELAMSYKNFKGQLIHPDPTDELIREYARYHT